jgi:hypothetical protein
LKLRGGGLQVFKLWGSHCKITETSWVKSEFSPIFYLEGFLKHYINYDLDGLELFSELKVLKEILQIEEVHQLIY